MKLSDGEKLILYMVADLTKQLKLRTEINPDFVMNAVTSGDTWILKARHRGIFDCEEVDESIVRETDRIMGMWSVVERSVEKLSKPDVEKLTGKFGEAAMQFRGFDGNGSEGHYGVAVRFVRDLDLFQEFAGRDLNSHWPTHNRDRGMLAAYEATRDRQGIRVDPFLSLEQLAEVLQAAVRQ